MRETSANPGLWLFGNRVDLLLGCGLLYAIGLIPFAIGGQPLVDWLHPSVLLLAILFFSAPHYGATLVRVYEHRDDRRSYALFSVFATALVAVAFVAGVYDATLSAYLLTVYLTWSPWHYTGQNYGLSVMFLRRSGVALPVGAKRALYLSFVLSYALTFVVMHTGAGLAWDPRGAQAQQVSFLAFGIPRAVAEGLVPALLVLDVAAIGTSLALLLRAGAGRSLIPAFALVASQALWFTLPFAGQFLAFETGLAPIDAQQRVVFYVQLVAVAHAIQYLWVTTYYARGSGGWGGYGRYLGKTLLAGIAIWIFPVVLFAPDRAGGLSYDGGLTLLVAAAVNIHHFILDGAIWKLRNLRVANVLIRKARVGIAAAAAPERGGLRIAVWSACAVALAIWTFVFVSNQIWFPAARARGDFEAQRSVLDRVAWFGFEEARMRVDLGVRMARAGRDDLAAATLERGLRSHPDATGYRVLALVREKAGDFDAADRTLSEGLEALGDERTLLISRASLWFARGEFARALVWAERALALDADDEELRIILSEIQRRLGEPDRAVEHARAAFDARPDSIAAGSRLAWLLSTLPAAESRDPGEAVAIMETLVAANPDPGARALDALAASYAAAGRFADASRVGEQAVRQALRVDDAALAAAIRARAELYRENRAYRDES